MARLLFSSGDGDTLLRSATLSGAASDSLELL